MTTLLPSLNKKKKARVHLDTLHQREHSHLNKMKKKNFWLSTIPPLLFRLQEKFTKAILPFSSPSAPLSYMKKKSSSLLSTNFEWPSLLFFEPFFFQPKNQPSCLQNKASQRAFFSLCFCQFWSFSTLFKHHCQPTRVFSFLPCPPPPIFANPLSFQSPWLL